jgi:hypothetical protein
MDLKIVVSPGELIDRITILEIKRSRIADAERRRLVTEALDALSRILSAHVPASPQLAAFRRELKAVNEALWQAEEDLRDHERRKVFDTRFVEIARSVCVANDHRSALKRQINELLGSPLFEEKVYASTE